MKKHIRGTTGRPKVLKKNYGLGGSMVPIKREGSQFINHWGRRSYCKDNVKTLEKLMRLEKKYRSILEKL